MIHLPLIRAFLSAMHKFQKDNNVDKMCIDNSTLLCSFIRELGIQAKVKAVFAIINDLNSVVHMVVELPDNTILDPSYAVATNSPEYADSVKQLLAKAPNICIVKCVIDGQFRFTTVTSLK
jgi:hypothetical protein